MMHIKQTKNKKSEIIMVEKKPKMQSANTNTSIITYSPSKFIARAGTPYTKIQTHTQTNTNTNIARASAPTTAASAKIPTAGAANTSYYVVKAGQLGSAASILSSPPKAATAASAAPATISTESVIIRH